jgi:myo-inositol-1(or 4)-monophosphatase
MEQILEAAYQTAIAAAIEAGNHVLRYWPNPLNKHFDKNLVLQIFEKNEGVGNYATIADTESEAIIIKRIKENKLFNTHSIIAEESTPANTSAEYKWLIDPIDGTLNFRNGMAEFGVSIGLLHNNVPMIGVIAMPAYGTYIAAIKGMGAKLYSSNKKELLDLRKLEYTQPLDKALIAFDTGYTERAKQIAATGAKFADAVGYPPSYASASIANCRIALGHIGAYVHETPTFYDIGAAVVIVTEVGGIVSDFNGKPIDWSTDNTTYVAARTPQIHKQLLELLKK